MPQLEIDQQHGSRDDVMGGTSMTCPKRGGTNTSPLGNKAEPTDNKYYEKPDVVSQTRGETSSAKILLGGVNYDCSRSTDDTSPTTSSYLEDVSTL